MFKKLVLLFFSFSILFSQDFTIKPVIKSFLVPGWGEKILGNKKRSRFFSNIEISLLTTCIGSYLVSQHQVLQYRTYASNHANVKVRGKSHKYWVDIGNYLNIDEHNAEHLRWREFDAIYDRENSWSWDTESNMKKFEKMRIKSDYYKKAGEYILGATILNHIISAIDVIYLSKVKELSFLPKIDKEKIEMQVIINL